VVCLELAHLLPSLTRLPVHIFSCRHDEVACHCAQLGPSRLCCGKARDALRDALDRRVWSIQPKSKGHKLCVCACVCVCVTHGHAQGSESSRGYKFAQP
jgi:hypothetical protein